VKGLGRSFRPNGRVSALALVRWKATIPSWCKSAVDWNYTQRAVSAFLTNLLGDKYHPFRRRVLAAVPRAIEVARVLDVTPERFRRFLDHVPISHMLVAIVATGLSVGEYLRLASRRRH
jgi:hypothetical protein